MLRWARYREIADAKTSYSVPARLLHVSSLVVGCLIMAASVVGVVLAGGFLRVLDELFVFFFGVVVVFMEGSTVQMNMPTRHFHYARYRRKLYYFAKFLFVPPWRGYFYLFVSALMLGQSTVFDVTVGTATLVLAGVWIYFGHGTAAKLVQLKAHFLTEEAVKEAFAYAAASYAASLAREGRDVEDVDPHELTLDRAAYELMCHDAEVEFRPIELDISILMIDADQNGKVALQDFVEWWQLDL